MADFNEVEMNDLSDAFYDAALDPELWSRTLEHMRRMFGALGAMVHVFDQTVASHAGPPSSALVMSAGLDPVFNERYFAHYGRLDPIAAALGRRPIGDIITGRHDVPMADFLRSEFYNEWLQPQDILGGLFTAFGQHGHMTAMVALPRSPRQPDFDALATDALRSLLPHLQRAVRTTCRLAAASTARTDIETLLSRMRDAVVLLGSDGAILCANRAAETVLRRADGLTVLNGELHARQPPDNAALRRALFDAAHARGTTLAVTRPSGQTPFALAIEPASSRQLAIWDPGRLAPRPAALVFIVDPEGGSIASGRALRELYGLTAAEIAVATTIAGGGGVADAARTLGSTPATVRWHLKHVFAKTSTTRQAELTRLVTQLAALENLEGA